MLPPTCHPSCRRPPRPAQSVSWLLSVPGASRTMLEVKVPYSTSSLAEVLGHEPEAAYASSETAAELARAAYRQAANLSEFGAAILGVGCTCALTTDREKRGEHKARQVLGGIDRSRRPCPRALPRDGGRRGSLGSTRRPRPAGRSCLDALSDHL